MKRKFLQQLFLMLLFIPFVYSQETKNNEMSIKFSGFIRNDMFFDSRQIENMREGAIPLYPKNESFDKVGKDLNDHASLNMLSLHTRLTTKITGPDALGARTSGLIEGEYFGGSEADINGFRLRHAFVKLDWENTSLLIGQYWHPMFNLDIIPSFNFAAPIIPYSRNPQIKLSYNMGKILVSGSLLTQRDFRSTGPNGISSEYLRNASLPMADLLVQWKDKGNTFGVNLDYKSIQPNLKTSDGKSTDEKIGSYAVNGFLKLSVSDFSFKLQGVYGQNLFDITLLGGYATKKDNINEYTNINTFSIWSEISYGKDVSGNLFFGYVKNVGADDEIAAYYTRGYDIDNVMKIAPNIIIQSGQARFVGEFEYTIAGYGKPDLKGCVKDIKNINNIRITLSSIYYF